MDIPHVTFIIIMYQTVYMYMDATNNILFIDIQDVQNETTCNRPGFFFQYCMNAKKKIDIFCSVIVRSSKE